MSSLRAKSSLIIGAGKRVGFLLCAVAVLPVLLVPLAAAQAPAQPKAGLAISPPTFELTANPGDKLKNSLRVDNIADVAQEVTVLRRNFEALGEEGGIDLSEGDSPYSLANWIQVSPDKITIPARQSQTFDFSIGVPANAAPGGRFGSIVFKTDAKPVPGQSGVAISQELGALVFVKIAGDVQEKALLAGFDTSKKMNAGKPVDFNVRVKNEGNVQFKPTGTITISNFLGRKVATVPIDAQNVLPGATRKMSGKWQNRWMLGRYQATASVVYGSNKQILTSTTSFWAFPYQLTFKNVAVVLIILVPLGALIYTRRKRIIKAIKILLGRE
jgi:hypothetical protein